MNYLSEPPSFSNSKEVEVFSDNENSIEFREPYISLPWETQLKKQLWRSREQTFVNQEMVIYEIEDVEEELKDFDFDANSKDEISPL